MYLPGCDTEDFLNNYLESYYFLGKITIVPLSRVNVFGPKTHPSGTPQDFVM